MSLSPHSTADHVTNVRIPVSHPLQRVDRGSLRVGEDGVYDEVTHGQRGSLCLSPRQDSLLLRIVAKEFRDLKKGGGNVQRRRAHGRGVGQTVSPRRRAGDGRSDDGGEQRQDGVGHFHQTFSPSQHHGPLPVSRHVSSRQVCQEHFAQRPLHRGLQESQGSIGRAERGITGVSSQVADRVGRVSSRDVTPVWLLGVGSPSGQ